MKKVYIVAFLMIAVAGFVLLQAGDSVGTYGTFSTAAEDGGSTKIVGTLAKDRPMIWAPDVDPNHFSFYLTDAENVVREVVLLMGKPQDFERSEQIVLTGRMEGERFIAKDIQLKCPSKYTDEESYLKDLVQE
ncbi:MAG: cytochrome c maturation protein CcmE [Saprospiraceae bacterium]